jgi:hypothetical protein
MRLSLIETGTYYRATANVVEMQAVLPADESALQVSEECPLNTTELRQQHEAVIAGAFAYDLSEGASLVQIDRFRRACDRTIKDNLERLATLQQNRLARGASEQGDDGDGDNA